jgi:hypothetical protein
MHGSFPSSSHASKTSLVNASMTTNSTFLVGLLVWLSRALGPGKVTEAATVNLGALVDS